MKLFLINTNYSGAQTYVEHLLEYMAIHTDFELYNIYLFSRKYKTYTEVRNDKILDVHIPCVSGNNFSLKKYSKCCMNLIDKLIRNDRNVIFHLNHWKQMEIGFEARRRYGARLIFTLHYLPYHFSSIENIEITDDLIELRDRKCINEVDGVICVTCFAKQVLCKYYEVSEKKIRVIYNGYSLYNEKGQGPIKAELKSNFGLSAKDVIVLFAGRLELGKGLEEAILAFNSVQYKNAKFLIAGSGNYDAYLPLPSNSMGRVHFLGKLSKNELNQLYRIASIGVIPSGYEQCSYVALEMMKFGLAIIASDVQGLNELFQNREDSILVPSISCQNDMHRNRINVSLLKEELERLLGDNKMRSQLGKKAKEKWRQSFMSEHMGHKTKYMYEECLRQN